MAQFFSSLSDRYKLFAFVFLLIISGSLLLLFGKGTQETLIFSGIIAVVLYIAKPIWFSDRYGQTTVRILSLTIAGAAVAAFVGWPAFVEKLIKPYLPDNQANLLTNNLDFTALIVFVFLGVVIYRVNDWRDSTGMGVHTTPLDRDVPEPQFKERLKMVAGSLTDDLKSIDTKTNWSARYFTPLDAEVEVNTASGKERKITDLLSAIKSRRNSKKQRIFLVLGSPGAGKSVALRKLCQDLEQEVPRTGKIPVYINLREWHVAEKWSETNPPTVQQLRDFILENLKSRDIVTSKFFHEYFDRMYETGRLFFVLDSFDEIPAVLDERENSELIHQLSEVMFKFLKGARQREAQGILASRLFRKPTHEFQTDVTLEIRPFTEQKIISTFENYGLFSKDLVKKLFKDRPELVPIARNPFSAVLIAEYTEKNNGELPPNQSEMYRDYFERTLDSCAERIRKKGLTKEQVINHTIDIASVMFKNYGLEAPVPIIAQHMPDTPVEDVLDILKFARLGRLGSGGDNVFSFSHRRFIEYFTVQRIIRQDETIELDAIPNDSQWRDALVLYCEVAPFEKAQAIANFCWNTIEAIDNPQDLRVIHSMRFLRDAFQGRKECINLFKEKLYDYVLNTLNPKNSTLSIKYCLDLVSLTDQSRIELSLYQALLIKNRLITGTALNNCRNLESIS